jgi:hypothetical protein
MMSLLSFLANMQVGGPQRKVFPRLSNCPIIGQNTKARFTHKRLEITIRSGHGHAPYDECTPFTIVSPVFLTEDAIEIMIGEKVKTVSVDQNEICIARAYNELDEEGYLIWPRTSILVDEEHQEHFYLWFEDIDSFPEELWEILQSEEDAEREEKSDYNEY